MSASTDTFHVMSYASPGIYCDPVFICWYIVWQADSETYMSYELNLNNS